ncbi:MAG: hypothetical protein ABJF11_00395 [Reichenbachiella sp.]|uniref:hypothetical protein n=1 Tax=Reichenbachiella sp. TaxID=2184521 RepID=UPI0032657956
MIDKLIAYPIGEVKKKLVIAKAKTWFAAGLIKEDQWKGIQAGYSSELFSPSIFMRVLLFIATYFGLTTVLGPVILLVANQSMATIRIVIFIVGAIILAFTDRSMIISKKHYKSGITEAGYYAGFSFIYFGLLGFDHSSALVYWIIAMLLASISTIRYMDLLSLLVATLCLTAILFLTFEPYLFILPFIIIIVFAALFLLSQQIQKKVDYLLWEDHFILFDSLALLLVYLGGNYFVVRELSIEMMGMDLSSGEDIPGAFVFYGLTFITPIAYLVWGISQRSVLFIRMSLLAIALSIFTIKYYYSLAPLEVTMTVGGGLLILISLALIKYLKTSPYGFTREQIVQGKWDNTDLVALVASQTLGPQDIEEPESVLRKGDGKFGGGGASGDF